MDNKYIDFLLVEKQDGSVAAVIAESCSAEIGYVVEFDNGTLGRVVKKAWGSERDGELHDFLTAIVPAYEAEATYCQNWKKETDDGTVPGNS